MKITLHSRVRAASVSERYDSPLPYGRGSDRRDGRGSDRRDGRGSDRRDGRGSDRRDRRDGRGSDRRGFTLIELMVAMALTLVIMTILAQAFVMALETFSALKGLGDMQQQLRTAAVVLRNDLSAEHFEGSRRLSDPNMTLPNQGPQAGFFAIRHGSAPTPQGPGYVWEGNDKQGVPSYRAVDHLLHLTVRRRGNRQEDFFTTMVQGDGTTAQAAVLQNFFAKKTAYNIPSTQLPSVTMAPAYNPFNLNPPPNQGVYSSQWAEVLYYLVQTGNTDPSLPGGLPTYSLYRAQFVMAADNTELNSAQIPNTYAPVGAGAFPLFQGLACNPGTNSLYFYTPADAALGNRTINLATLGTDTRLIPNTTSVATTLVLPNVISFQVQVMKVEPRLGINDMTFGDIPVGNAGGLYDTTKFNQTGYTNNFGLKAIQVTMRVWDAATRQTRQASIVVDM